MEPPIPPDKLDRIRQALLDGNKIEAIKIYREATGLGLAESKQAVEDFDSQWRSGFSTETGHPTTSKGSLPPEKLELIRQALVAGKKIEAIRLYREATSLGLAEAKRAVEALEANWRAAMPGEFPKPSTGCFGLLLLAGSVIALLYVFPKFQWFAPL